MKNLLSNLELSERNLNSLSFLIETEDDYHEFVEGYWNKDKFSAIYDYRQDKIKALNADYRSFLVRFKENAVKGLEWLFQHKIRDCLKSISKNLSIRCRHLYYRTIMCACFHRSAHFIFCKLNYCLYNNDYLVTLVVTQAST